MLLTVLLLACLLLTACTPEGEQETEPKLPTAEVPIVSTLPDVTNSALPTSGSDPVSESETPATQAETQPLQPTETEPVETEPETEFSGMVIDDGYTETLGEDVGVIGN